MPTGNTPVYPALSCTTQPESLSFSSISFWLSAPGYGYHSYVFTRNSFLHTQFISLHTIRFSTGNSFLCRQFVFILLYPDLNARAGTLSLYPKLETQINTNIFLNSSNLGLKCHNFLELTKRDIWNNSFAENGYQNLLLGEVTLETQAGAQKHREMPMGEAGIVGLRLYLIQLNGKNPHSTFDCAITGPGECFVSLCGQRINLTLSFFSLLNRFCSLEKRKRYGGY